MVKTSRQVQGDIYDMLKGSPLEAAISGGIYRQGMRPRDSRLEDAVVIFTSGLTGDIESGVVTINIYVTDIDPYGNGVKVEDVERTEAIEAVAQQWVDSLTADRSSYKFELREAISTEAEEETSQHFVVVALKYRYYEINQN